MAEIKKINVNGTDYDIVPTGSEFPIACIEGYDDCGLYITNFEEDENVYFCKLDESNFIPIMKKIPDGNDYKYQLVFIVKYNHSNDYPWVDMNVPQDE